MSAARPAVVVVVVHLTLVVHELRFCTARRRGTESGLQAPPPLFLNVHFHYGPLYNVTQRMTRRPIVLIFTIVLFCVVVGFGDRKPLVNYSPVQANDTK